ncbi:MULTISPECIES: hypothetical protein [unclassified Streptomyces]
MFLLLVSIGPGSLALDRLFARRSDAEPNEDRTREQAPAVAA